MPSQATPRSTSDSSLLSSSSSKTRLPPPSNPSACSSSRSSKSVYWLAWSNINKIGSLVTLGRNNSDSSSRHSDLTEESLEAHNRRQQQQQQQQAFDSSVYDKNAKCSPYYKGLTDYSLIINREKHQDLPHQPASPGRESHATTVATSHSVSSFVLVKIQEWSSCFSSLKSSSNYKQNSAPAPAPVLVQVQVQVPPPVAIQPPLPSHDSPVPVPVPFFAPPVPTGADTMTVEKEHPYCSNNTSLSFEPSAARMPVKKKEVHKDVLSGVNEEKPLRERVSSESKSLPLLA